MDEEEKKKRRSILKRIGDAFGFGKTAEDIQHSAKDAEKSEDADEYDRATGLLKPKKKKLPESY